MVREFGGTFTSSRVTLICNSGFPEIRRQSSYLLFLHLDRHYPLGVAIAYGSSGIFEIDKTGALKSLASEQSDPVSSQLREFHVYALADLKRFLHTVL